MPSYRPKKRDDDAAVVWMVDLRSGEIPTEAGSLDSPAKRALVLALLAEINTGDRRYRGRAGDRKWLPDDSIAPMPDLGGSPCFATRYPLTRRLTCP
jgi:hypothetical protein